MIRKVYELCPLHNPRKHLFVSALFAFFFVCLFELMLYVPVNIFSVILDVFWVKPEQRRRSSVFLLKTQHKTSGEAESP